MKLVAENTLNKETGLHYVLTNQEKVVALHTHDFYEIFAVIEGELIHCVNGIEIKMTCGDAVVVRPHDFHTIKKSDKHKFINIAFSVSCFESLVSYAGYSADKILSPALPPTVHIGEKEIHSLTSAFFEAETATDKPDYAASVIRLAVARLTLLFFTRESLPDKKDWFLRLLDKLNHKDNFSLGQKSISLLSDYSYEHICREFRKRLNTTPTDYINSIRINYVSNMLINTELPIIDIAFDAGFGNLGYFYTLFNKKHSMPPKKFRQKYSKVSQVFPENT